MKLETKRLLLTELQPCYIEDLKEILQDPEIMYAYPHPLSDQEVEDWYQRQLVRYQKDGFGLEAILLKENGKMIGQAGLTMQLVEGKSVLEVGYLLKKSYWHCGYATEIAQELLNYAWDVLKADRVHAIINDNNEASQQVAQRLGMQRVQSFIYNEMPHGLWRIEKNEHIKSIEVN